jgi:hypothetical protein
MAHGSTSVAKAASEGNGSGTASSGKSLAMNA